MLTFDFPPPKKKHGHGNCDDHVHGHGDGDCDEHVHGHGHCDGDCDDHHGHEFWASYGVCDHRNKGLKFEASKPLSREIFEASPLGNKASCTT